MSVEDVQRRYAVFAADEAPGRSAVYADWARRVASDVATAEIIARLPATRRQPPLVFGAARLLGASDGDADGFAAWAGENADALVIAAASRSVQTNEPLRCAVLLPALSLVSGPIALLEVGASAGMCLFPDRYAYEYVRPGRSLRHGGGAVSLRTELPGPCDPPLGTPEIVWRAGIDLAPLDARSTADTAWIRALVWPGETERAARIDAALEVVRADPPLMVAGDAVDLLTDVAALAPAGTTLVVTTPGVLPHVPRAGREVIIRQAMALPGHWITFDSPTLHDAWNRPPAISAGFALALDGEVIAAADPLGRWLEWRGPDRAAAG